MTIARFEVFSKVIELGSFTKAAEHLRMTQSAVSHAIAGLESDWGMKLLLRDRKKGFALTEAGHQILIPMKEILNQMERIKQIVAFTSELKAGTIRVGSFPSATACILPKIIAKFQKKYPSITFTFFEGNYEEILEWFETGVIDIGVVVQDSGKQLNLVPLIQDRMVVAFPDGHRLQSKEEAIHIDDLLEEPFIMPKGVYRSHVEDIFAKANIKPNIRFEVQDCNTISSMVQEGLGITIGPELFLKDQSHIRVGYLTSPNWRTIALAFPSSDYVSPAVQAFLTIAQDLFSNKTNE